jgi:hypothetical protein
MDSSTVISLAEEVLAGLRFAYGIKDTLYRDALLAAIRETNQRVNAALPIRRAPPSRRDTLPPPPQQEEEVIGVATAPLPAYRAFMAAISPLVRGNLTDVGNLWRLSAEATGSIQERIDWAKDYIRSSS